MSPCRMPKNKKIFGACGAHKTQCSSQLTDYKTVPLECFLLNITLRDLPRKCEQGCGKCGKILATFRPPPPYDEKGGDALSMQWMHSVSQLLFAVQ